MNNIVDDQLMKVVLNSFELSFHLILVVIYSGIWGYPDNSVHFVAVLSGRAIDEAYYRW